MDVFAFDDYKSVLKAAIAEASLRGYQSSLADAAGCQRAFLSQVLNTHVHLTPDHAAGLAVFWGLSELESDYFIELVNYERAGTPALQMLTLRRLKTLKRRRADLSKKFSETEATDEAVGSIYYSSWPWMAVHVLCSIPGFQSSDAIAKKLGLTSERTEEILNGLKKMNLVKRTSNATWKPAKNDVFLARSSPMTFTNHWNWRQKALEDIQRKSEDSVHYSTLHALSRRDSEKFKSLLMKFISDSRELVAPSPEEELICFCCDLFTLESQS